MFNVQTGNCVEATFDTVERIVQLVAFDNVASTSLLVWTGLKARLFTMIHNVKVQYKIQYKILYKIQLIGYETQIHTVRENYMKTRCVQHTHMK